MTPKKILLFGSSGFLGSKIFEKNKEIIAPTHSFLDLTDVEKVYRYIYKSEPKKIIYSAGISKIDFAQKNKAITNNLNYKIPKLLSKFALKNNIDFIYISTDAVFDGYKNKYEFKESDKTNSKSVYGISKQKGEDAVLSSNQNTVIRIINLFGKNNENFYQKMINNLSLGKTFPGIVDQINNPLNIDLAAQSILFSIENNLHGIYNLGATNSISNYNFLVKAAEKMNFNASLIKKISFNDFFKNESKYRKKKSVLKTEKFQKESRNTILKDINNSISYLNLM
jgi:dTDP-4-dehydrorhamnose reductase